MFRFRLTSHTRTPGLFRLEEKEFRFALPDGHALYIVARDSDALRFARKIHFEGGKYSSEEEARAAGEKLRIRLRVLNAALSLGLDVHTSDRISGHLGEEFQRELEAKSGTRILPNVSGLLIFPDDERHCEFIMNGEAEVFPSESRYWLDGLSQLWEGTIELDEKSEDALSLLNLATLEPSPRSSFLVTYLALERLIPSRRRSRESLALLGRLKRWVEKAATRKISPIPEGERDALLGSLGRLEHESFGNTLKRVGKENEERIVEGVPLTKFLAQCTNARHKTAHPAPSTVPPEYERLSRGMRTVAMGILWNLHGIAPISFHRPADKFSMPQLESRTIEYLQR